MSNETESDGVYHALKEEERNDAELEEAIMDARAKAFNPTAHFMKVRGGADYLEVKWRVVWFREDYEHGSIVTRLLSHTDNEAVFVATVSDGLGGVGTGHGSETIGDFNDYLEKAETKAIGRALASMGYGTSSADYEMGVNRSGEQTIVDAPVRRDNQRRPFDDAPRRGQFDRKQQAPDAPATAAQLRFLKTLREQTNLTSDAGFGKWLIEAGFMAKQDQTYTKSEAGSIINALNERKAATHPIR